MKPNDVMHKIDIKLIVLILIVIGLSYGVWVSSSENKSLSTSLLSQQDILATKAIEFETKSKELESTISTLTTEKDLLTEALTTEQNKNNEFEKQINRIASKVGTLEKLSKTDPELLQKYSKVYFLNEHYIPSSLTLIDEKYTFDETRSYEIHTNVNPYLKKLFNEAESEKIPLLVVSAYRSFDTQASLKTGYKVIYGAGSANQFSADQGYSEHQLGTTVDFTTPTLGANFEKFESTETFTWLTENAYRFGFVLSYPKGNEYYQYEPWHWRFVGVDLARKLHRDKINFYDEDQREIDEYLVDLFD